MTPGQLLATGRGHAASAPAGNVEHDGRMAVIAESLALAFEEHGEPVFSDIDAAVREGETVLLLGPSGCGKSSLAFCLTGLYPYAVDSQVKGRVSVYGKPLADYESGDIAQLIGIVFQDFESQFCMLRVEEEIAFCLENRNCPRTDMDSAIHEVLNKVGLNDWRHAFIHELSGGMKQKLALACALALRTRMLVLDEPTSNLDPHARRQFAGLVAELSRKEGLALLIIEHQLDDWIGLADRLLVMDADGTIAYDGLPASYFKHRVIEAKAHGIWLPRALELQQALAEDLPASGKADGTAGNALADTAMYTGDPPLTEQQLLAALCSLPREAQATALRLLTPTKTKRPHTRDRVLLQANGLVYRRQGRAVIDGVTLALHAGEWVALVGPNGAGKSTIASLLSGLTRPDVGHILLQGIHLHRYAERELRASIGYVFQNPEHQFIADTVRDELAFSLRLQGIGEEEVQRQVAGTLTRFRLTKMEDANPFSLSQGQKRRLSVAAVLTDSQQLLICDEPTYGQDAYASKQLMEMLHSRVQGGAAVLMITHDMEWVEAYADRVIVLSEGQIRYDGSPAALWREHASLLEANHLRMPMNYSVAEQLRTLNQHAEGGARI
ncbi:ABC transporter ATP-binding protein [Paenibacillus apiarius]|uniref:ABC transporter ATP-binding protein n=1 Tax=Paenibacillus apiarius TaxID=46240 RepID=UPI00197DBA75|nr:ABC transporter ATP-binding protein [Paenibacillus apiarius]MBN3523975.1 ATP-binding cassette domain-containing protein [Paenibacillus apiarius]